MTKGDPTQAHKDASTYGNQSSSLFEMNKANESLRMEKRTPKFSEIIN